MLNCSKLGLILKYKRDAIPMGKIKNEHFLEPSQQDKMQLLDLGQVTPLTVIKNGKSTYSLLAGDQLYAAMLDLYRTGDQRFAIADCLVVSQEGLSDLMQKLIVAYRPVEMGLENADAYRLDWIDILLKVAKEQDISQTKVISLVADLLRQSNRYARMYVTIAANGISELREAVTTPASGRRVKSNHITVEKAARIAGLPAEKQKEALIELQSHLTSKPVTEQTGKQKAVASWLKDVQKQIDQSKTVEPKDLELLVQASKCYRLMTSSAQNESGAESNSV